MYSVSFSYSRSAAVRQVQYEYRNERVTRSRSPWSSLWACGCVEVVSHSHAHRPVARLAVGSAGAGSQLAAASRLACDSALRSAPRLPGIVLLGQHTPTAGSRSPGSGRSQPRRFAASRASSAAPLDSCPRAAARAWLERPERPARRLPLHASAQPSAGSADERHSPAAATPRAQWLGLRDVRPHRRPSSAGSAHPRPAPRAAPPGASDAPSPALRRKRASRSSVVLRNDSTRDREMSGQRVGPPIRDSGHHDASHTATVRVGGPSSQCATHPGTLRAARRKIACQRAMRDARWDLARGDHAPWSSAFSGCFSGSHSGCSGSPSGLSGIASDSP